MVACGGFEAAQDLPAAEALLILEDVLKDAEIQAFRHQQILHYASLPLFQNAETLPDPPEPPEWLAELMDEG